MEETKELITTDDIRSKVYIIRGQQVMLDKDLAEIYGYEVKKLNQQVKRNIERFPEDFMFRLSNSEIDSVRSQIVTSRKKDFFAGQEGGRRYLPYAFTEQGIYMLATVLRGKLAEQQSIFIMRTFREMRHYIRQNQQFVTRNEMDLLTAKVGTITERQDRMENKVDSIQKDVNIFAYKNGYLSCAVTICRICKQHDEAWLLSVYGYCRTHRVYEYGEYHDHEYYDKKAGIWCITGCGYDK